MSLTNEQEKQLQQHLKKQGVLENNIAKICLEIEAIYQSDNFIDLKKQIKMLLLHQLNTLTGREKLAVILIDIQNDFTLPEFALFAPGGQHTILSNMALLDAIIELSKVENIKHKLEIVTSQDAHRLGRTMDDAEAQMMAKAYTEEKAEIAIATEQQELKSNNPLEKSYGLHCITGTIGAAIAKPIEHRLNQLKSLSFAITRFGKINFSGPEAGMRLQDNIDLSHTHFLEASQVIYHPSNQSYIQFFRDKQFKSIYVTGICGDICVQQAAEGLKEELPHTKMMVVDACTHYLVLPEKPYDATRTSVTSSYDKKGISVITVPNWRSNPDCASKLYPIDNTPPILACYMHYPNACNAIVAGLAVASVVVATALMLGTTPTAVVIVGAAIGFGAIGAGITFFNPLTLQRNVEHSSGCALSN